MRPWLVSACFSLVALAGVTVMACGSSDPAPDTSGSSSSSGSIGGNVSGDDDDSSDCVAAAGLVYVVSAEDDLYSFLPSAGEFKKVGRLDCAAPTGVTPNSMAVDRQGNAWVNYTDGTLFKVSTATAKCTATSFVPNQAGFAKMGMAFATTGAKSNKETLYIVGLDSNDSKIGKGLGTIDLATFELRMLGDFSDTLAGRGAELTGTGDGQVFGFFTTKPDASLALINRASGATTDTTGLPGVDTGESWAFSFWGGDFWFYTSPGGSTPSKVTRLKRSSDDSLAVSTEDVGGFRIVGAGVSTCAPLEPPK